MRLLIALFLLAAPLYGESYEAVISSTTPKVVTIQVTGVVDAPVYLSVETSTKTVVITGSGSFISSDGTVLTCNHLFEMKMADRTVQVITANGHVLTAIVIGQDDKQDLALLKVFPLHPVQYFKLGKSLHQGQPVLSFGSPLGIEKVVTFGFVSKVSAKANGEKVSHTLHTASINPGNSGGPLVNMKGELVGVNVASYLVSMFMAAEGMHLAVKLDTIEKFLRGK